MVFQCGLLVADHDYNYHMEKRWLWFHHYFCALTGFDQSLYEAAEIDGASRWQRIRRITLPLLKPTIIIMFLLNIGGILAGGVDQIMGMTSLNPLLLEKTDTIATFVYRSAIVNGQFESASAITLYQSIFGSSGAGFQPAGKEIRSRLRFILRRQIRCSTEGKFLKNLHFASQKPVGGLKK